MLGNWIKQTTTTTGTGTLTIDSVSGFPRYADLFESGELVKYVLLNSSGEPLECGIGTLSYSGSKGSPSGSVTLARTVVQATYSGGTYTDAGASAVSLSGTTTVKCAVNDSAMLPNAFAVNTDRTADNRLIWPKNAAGYSSTGNTNTSNNRVHYYPFLFGFDGQVNGFAVRQTGTTANMDIGLYQVKSDGKPGDLIVGVNNHTTTAGSNVIAFTSFRIKPGWYYVGINTANSATQFFRCSMTESLLGASDTTSVCTLATQSSVTQGTLPDPAGTNSPYTSVYDAPLVCLRAG